jgi:glycerol-3-phosphate dehydrogenase
VSPIAREVGVRRAAAAELDLLIVGGGVQGIALALEAARRGISTLLLERGDFAAATSANSLRIVHGGLRYLQSFDLPRFRVSVAERRWFLLSFPDLVEPLPCLMPLYSPPRGGRLRRAAALRLALAGNDLLGRGRNEGLRGDRALPRGRILSSRKTAELAPAIDRDGLAGGALWYDATMPDSARLLSEMLRWAVSAGAQALHHVAVEGLLTAEGRTTRVPGITGVRARDRLSGESLTFRARRVANCAGPWVREVAGALDRDLPELFAPALAFNLLLDREPPAAGALAVASRRRGARTHFLVASNGRVMAGTCHCPGPAPDGPSEGQIEAFLADLNAALPAFAVSRREVLQVLWGILPAERPGAAEPADRPVVLDHGAQGGPRGLVSIAGVKLTTARAVAEQALSVLYGRELPGYLPGTGRPPVGVAAREPQPAVVAG